LGAACEGHADIALQLVHAKANVNEQFKVREFVLFEFIGILASE
jgi:hypothetical protein